jgi:hypothetical protein
MARSLRSFVFFVLATFALVNAVSIDHGYISTISRQTSTRVLSFRADLSSLSSLTNIVASYSVGISAGTTEIISWQVIAGLQAVNTITETFATPLPDDYTVFINLKVVDTETSAETIYSSASLKVGNRLASDPTCAAIFNPVGTSTVTPPQPTITIAYNNNEQLFHFDIVAQYLLQGWTWVIDFVPFTGDYTKGTKGLAATNCENRQTADLTGRAFADFWNAAPASDFTTALNSKNYLAYRLGTASPKWTVSANGCDKVAYTTAGFSFDDLLDCRHSDGTTPSIIRTIVNGAIQYNGTLYVTAVKAVNPLVESEGFQVAQFTAPFFVSFSVSSTAISSGTDNNIFAFAVASLNIQADGNLAMSLATNTFDEDFHLTSPSVTTQPSGVALATTGSAPADAQLQTWAFKTTEPDTDYSGIYAIQFTRTDGTSSATVTAQFTLSLSVNSEYGNTGNVLPTVLSFWDSNAFDGAQEKTSYTSLDVIYIKSTVTIQNGQDESSYANSIYNVWLCYTVDNSAPVYNPTNNQFGCTAQTWNIRPITQLVSNGNEVLLGALESQFATDVTNAIDGLTPVNSGFEFQAAPLATLRSGKFWVQVESRVNLPGKKRNALAESKSVKISAFEIVDGVLTPAMPSKTPFASSASAAQVTFGVAFLAAMLLF